MIGQKEQCTPTQLINESRGHVFLSLYYGSWRGAAITGIQEMHLGELMSIGDAIRSGRAMPMKNSRGRTSATLTLSVQGHSLQVYVKEDDLGKMGWWKLMKDNLRPSHLWRSWQRTWQLRAAGIPVQQPVAMLIFRRWGVVRKTVYVGEYLPDMVPLSTIMSERKGSGGTSTDAELLSTVMRELRTMHDKGFYHRDLKADNILAEHRLDRWNITFIDMEGVVAKRRLTEHDRAIDLGRLWLALTPWTAAVERERFLNDYASFAPTLNQTRLQRLINQRVNYLKARRFSALSQIGARLREETGQPQRWLIIALGSTHEVEQIAPLLAILRQGFPVARLDVLVRRGAESVLVQNHDLDELITITGAVSDCSSASHESRLFIQTIKCLRSRRYRVVVDLSGGVLSMVLTKATGASVRIGYRTASTLSKWVKRLICYTQVILANPEYRDTVRHYLLVAEALGLDSAESKLHIAEAPEERPATV
jgi:tRNA A-37 threonylcarbamoyl transferase component Bud32